MIYIYDFITALAFNIVKYFSTDVLYIEQFYVKSYILFDILQTELTYVQITFRLLRCIASVSMPELIIKFAVSSARHC